MSRYLPDPSIPVSPWAQEVLEAVRASKAPLYAVAYPAPDGGWQVSLLQGQEADVREGFRAPGPWPAGVDKELRQRGYVSLASLIRADWDPLPDHGRGSDVFPDPGENDDY